MNWRSCAENRDPRTWGFESSLIRVDPEAMRRPTCRKRSTNAIGASWRTFDSP